MDKSFFVQNIKNICKLRGIAPTVACRESGVGSSFINNIESRGQTPSVEKVQLLAEYLGVTTSELLGEQLPGGPCNADNEKKAVPPKGDGRREKFAQLFAGLTPEQQDLVIAAMQGFQAEK